MYKIIKTSAGGDVTVWRSRLPYVLWVHPCRWRTVDSRGSPAMCVAVNKWKKKKSPLRVNRILSPENAFIRSRLNWFYPSNNSLSPGRSMDTRLGVYILHIPHSHRVKRKYSLRISVFRKFSNRDHGNIDFASRPSGFEGSSGLIRSGIVTMYRCERTAWRRGAQQE